MRRWRDASAWLAVVVVLSALVAVRFRDVATDPSVAVGYDFHTYFQPAALAVAAGRTPYDVAGYVYSPLLAVGLAPFAHLPHLLLVWTALSLLAGVVAIGGSLLSLRSVVRGPALAVVGLSAAVTLFWSWPTTLDLFLGQSDLLVLATLALAGLAAHRRRTSMGGLLLLLAVLIKTWPLGTFLWLLRRPPRTRLAAMRTTAVAAFSAVVAVGVGMGPGAVRSWVAVTVGARDQDLVAWSVWGFGRHLFSAGTVVRPVLVSPVLATGSSLALAAVVVALLTLSLVRPGATVLSLWHVALATVLLLPVAHLPYLMLGLPVGWVWWARLLAHRGRRRVDWIVCGVYGAWWVVTFRVIWPGDSTTASSPLALVCVVGSSIVLLATSVVAEARSVQYPRPDSNRRYRRERAAC